MLVYEKKVDGTRHLFGKVEGTIPAANDTQLTYKDTDGTTITPELSDTYLNDGHGGIIRKSDGEAINVFIGETQIIGGDIPPAQMVSITVTPPTKTSYVEGDTLDLTGMVVTGHLSNEETIDITEDCSASPAAGATLATTDTKVTVTHTASSKTAEFAITVAELTGIEVTAPTTVTYTEGQTLDITGMVVKEVYSDGTKKTITTGFTTSPANGATLATTDTKVTVSYFELTDEFAITVEAATPVATGIEITTEPTKTAYTAGETLDLTGLVVSIVYDNGGKEATTDYLTTPASSAVLTVEDTEVVVSALDFEDSFTITVS